MEGAHKQCETVRDLPPPANRAGQQSPFALPLSWQPSPFSPAPRACATLPPAAPPPRQPAHAPSGPRCPRRLRTALPLPPPRMRRPRARPQPGLVGAAGSGFRRVSWRPRGADGGGQLSQARAEPAPPPALQAARGGTWRPTSRWSGCRPWSTASTSRWGRSPRPPLSRFPTVPLPPHAWGRARVPLLCHTQWLGLERGGGGSVWGFALVPSPPPHPPPHHHFCG